MARRQNQQTISWFWDLYNRDRLDLDPSYQRRSVWNQEYKNYFVDTLLLDYPAPAIFLYEELDPNGGSMLSVVDGKQRLTTIFEFVSNKFPVSENSKLTSHRGTYFANLDDTIKVAFWSYEFSVEYLPSSDETVVNEIFDRINRNTSRLTPQELRHARHSGDFITKAEDLTEWLGELLPGMPNIASKSRKQMKDVEFVAQLLLRLESKARGYSTSQLDEAFSDRDSDWEQSQQVEQEFRAVALTIAKILKKDESLLSSRLRNQADFYSLFGAISTLGPDLDIAKVARQLATFVDSVDARNEADPTSGANRYYTSARSASNDTAQRETREEILRKALG